MKTLEVMEALRRHCRQQGALYFEELRAGAGWGTDSQRRIDAWSIQTAPSKGNVRTAYEVKVSRSDFQSDMRKPQKQRPARLSSNRFYYVAPEGLIKPEELPIWAGLMEAKEWNGMHHVSVEIDSPFFDTEPPSWRFVVSLVRHAARHSGSERFGEG